MKLLCILSISLLTLFCEITPFTFQELTSALNHSIQHSHDSYSITETFAIYFKAMPTHQRNYQEMSHYINGCLAYFKQNHSSNNHIMEQLESIKLLLELYKKPKYSAAQIG